MMAAVSPGRPSLRRRVTLILTVLVVVVGGSVGGSGSPAHAQSSPTSYVALGDSFTAGPLIPDQIANPIGCLRSDSNYPHNLAPFGQQAFRDVSCSGARTTHMFNPQSVTGGPNPPQLNAVDTNTQLVTLGVGGNDIGFSEIIQECATINPFGTPCQDRFNPGGNDEISRRIAETAPRVGDVLAAISARAPDADVFVIGYIAILPSSGFGCWPSMPIAWRDVPYLRAKQLELNAMLANQAAAHGATYVDVYTPSIGHNACTSSGTRWVEPIIPANAAAPVHPNARGMAGVAGVIHATVAQTVEAAAG